MRLADVPVGTQAMCFQVALAPAAFDPWATLWWLDARGGTHCGIWVSLAGGSVPNTRLDAQKLLVD